jgi:hypothetical protein
MQAPGAVIAIHLLIQFKRDAEKKFLMQAMSMLTSWKKTGDMTQPAPLYATSLLYPQSEQYCRFPNKLANR